MATMSAEDGRTLSFVNEVVESAVIKAPISFVWHFIKLQEFDKFWSSLTKAEHVSNTSAETDIVRWTFKDGHVFELKQDEHSVRKLPCPSNADVCH